MITGVPFPRDLLGKEPQEKLEIKLCPDGSGQLYVPGLTEFRVQSVEDINKVWEDGGSELGRGLWCDSWVWGAFLQPWGATETKIGPWV